MQIQTTGKYGACTWDIAAIDGDTVSEKLRQELAQVLGTFCELCVPAILVSPASDKPLVSISKALAEEKRRQATLTPMLQASVYLGQILTE